MHGGLDERQSVSANLKSGTTLAEAIGDLKRIRDARGKDSLATRAFRGAWQMLCAGQDVDQVADGITADAIAATRLGAIDHNVLMEAGVADPLTILQRGFDDACAGMQASTRVRLRRGLGQSSRSGWPVHPVATLPAFVEALAAQPRAGATCPGKPRIILEPVESHADHCLAVAVIGVSLSDVFGADSGIVFLAGLCHHMHNASLPDSGFAGEVLLDDQLAPVLQTLFARELSTLPADVEGKARAALAVIGDAETPEGRAFHAADVIDRVLQMQYYERVAKFRARHALEDLNLVHEGPVQGFHNMILAEAGLS